MLGKSKNSLRFHNIDASEVVEKGVSIIAKNVAIIAKGIVIIAIRGRNNCTIVSAGFQWFQLTVVIVSISLNCFKQNLKKTFIFKFLNILSHLVGVHPTVATFE